MPNETPQNRSLISKITNLIIAIAGLLTAIGAVWEIFNTGDKSDIPVEEIIKNNPTIDSSKMITVIKDTSVTQNVDSFHTAETNLDDVDEIDSNLIDIPEFKVIEDGMTFVARPGNYLPFNEKSLRIFPLEILKKPKRQAETLISDSNNKPIKKVILKEGEYVEFKYKQSLFRVTLNDVSIRPIIYNLAYYKVEKASLN